MPDKTDSSPRPTRKLRWLIPALLLLAWLIVGGITGPFAGKLASVASNDSSSFLPASAESTQVQNLLADFQDTDEIPGIVIAERSGGITPGDLEFLRTTTSEVAGQPGFGPAVSPPIPSQDGQDRMRF